MSRITVATRRLCLAGGLGCLSMVACSTPRLVVPDGPWLDGEPIPIAVEGAEPGSLVTLTAERLPTWYESPVRSVAAFRADDAGSVNVITDPPVAARWAGPDPAGLFWTMREVDEPIAELASADHVGIRADFDGDGRTDSEQQFVLGRGKGGLVERPLPAEFPGAFLLLDPPAPGERLPVTVMLGGSKGSDIGARCVAPSGARHLALSLGTQRLHFCIHDGSHRRGGLEVPFGAPERAPLIAYRPRPSPLRLTDSTGREDERIR